MTAARQLSRPLLAALLLSAFAVRAESDPNAAKVRELYRAATAAYNIGEYKEALDNYKAAYRLRQDAAFLFNIAQCYRQLGDHANAARQYRAFLREEPTATNRQEVERQIEAMDKAAMERRASEPPVGTEPPKGEPTTASAPAPATAPAPAATQPEPLTGPKGRPWFKRPLVLGLLAGGVVAVGAGAALVGVGAGESGTYDNRSLPLDVRQAAYDRGSPLVTTGAIFLGIGGVALVGGVMAALFGRKAEPSHPLAWRIGHGPGQIGASLMGRF